MIVFWIIFRIIFSFGIGLLWNNFNVILFIMVIQDSHLKMINEELMLDEALRRNEINQQCQQPHDEISPPEQFQTKSGGDGGVATQHGGSPGRKPFSRSVSIGGGGKFKPEGSSNEDKKRNSSYETSAAATASDGLEQQSCNPGDFLWNPSAALKNLAGPNGPADILQRPVMGFVLQWNDLESLQISMAMALRKSACRTFAMQVNAIT